MENIRCQAAVYDINLTDQVGTLDTWKRKVKKNIQAKMMEEWRKGLQEKSSMHLYKQREVFKYDEYTVGDKASELLFKARTGDLEVNGHQAWVSSAKSAGGT